MRYGFSIVPVRVALAVAALMTAASLDAEEPHGFWVDGQGSSCDLACGAEKREAFRSGHYASTEGHYTICRIPLDYIGNPNGDYYGGQLRGRPGFQHQAGSPNVCKVHGIDGWPTTKGKGGDRTEGNLTKGWRRQYDCLCADRTPSLRRRN